MVELPVQKRLSGTYYNFSQLFYLTFSIHNPKLSFDKTLYLSLRAIESADERRGNLNLWVFLDLCRNFKRSCFFQS
jgi:hypothetical protein